MIRSFEPYSFQSSEGVPIRYPLPCCERTHPPLLELGRPPGLFPPATFSGRLRNGRTAYSNTKDTSIHVLNKAIPGKGGWRAYARGDGTSAERMCEMANRVKYSSRSQVRIEELTPLWLEKEGLGALDGYTITYAELAEELRRACEMAEDMVDPSALFQRLEKEREAASEEQEGNGTQSS